MTTPWTYHAFEEEATDSARLTMLRRHITEVNAKMNADISASGYSRSTSTLQQYLKELHDRRKELEASAGMASNGGTSFARRA